MSWGCTGGIPKIGPVDARAFIPVIPAGIIQNPVLIAFAVITLVVFAILGRFGFTIEVAYRRLRRRLAGRMASPFPLWYIARHDSSFNNSLL